MMTLEHLQLAVPVIGTADVAKTVAWYEKCLGFQKQWTWGEPAVYAGIQAGGAMLYICHDPEMAKAIVDRGLKPDVFLWVREIDSVYAQHRSNGAEILEELAVRPWGVRQYVVQDPNGYRLKIAEADAD